MDDLKAWRWNTDKGELSLSCSGPPSISSSRWLQAEISDLWIYRFCTFLCFHFCVGFSFHKAPLVFVYLTLWILGLALQITNKFNEPKGSFGLISAISTFVAKPPRHHFFFFLTLVGCHTMLLKCKSCASSLRKIAKTYIVVCRL